MNIALVADLISMLPSRSTGRSVESLPPARTPHTANDILDRPRKEAIQQAKTDIIQTEASWRECNASVQALLQSRNALVSRMNGLLASRMIVEYNALVPEENRQAEEIRRLQSACAQKHQTYVSAVDRHNEIIRQHQGR